MLDGLCSILLDSTDVVLCVRTLDDTQLFGVDGTLIRFECGHQLFVERGARKWDLLAGSLELDIVGPPDFASRLLQGLVEVSRAFSWLLLLVELDLAVLKHHSSS